MRQGGLDLLGRRQVWRQVTRAELADEEWHALPIAVVEDGDRPRSLAERTGGDGVVGRRITVATHEVVAPDGGVRAMVDRPVPVGNRHGRLDQPQLLLEEEHELPVPGEEGRTHVRGHQRAAEGIPMPEDEGVVDAQSVHPGRWFFLQPQHGIDEVQFLLGGQRRRVLADP